MEYRRLRQRRGKLGRPREGVNVTFTSAAIALAIGCVVTFRDVPRVGVNEVHQYLRLASRAPSALERLDSAPGVAWVARAGRGITGAPAVGERVMVVASADRWVHALDTRSGELFWRFRGPDAYGAGPIMANGLVYVATEVGDGFVTAIDLFTGRRRWQNRTGPVASPLAARDSTVFAVTQAGLLFALSGSDGTTRWTRVAGSSRAGPIVIGGTVAVPAINDSLFIFEAHSGRQLARVRLPVGVVAPLAAAGDSMLVAGSPAGALLGIRVPAGVVLWSIETGNGVAGSPAIHADTAYALTVSCDLWRVPLARPDLAQSVRLGCRTRAGPMIVRDGVLVATADGELQLHDRAGRRRFWSLDLGGDFRHPPIIQHGQVVAVPVLGDVVSLR